MRSAIAPQPTPRTRSAAAAAQALARQLRDLAEVVEGLNDEAYAAVPAGGLSGSTGAHVRHVLDHVATVVEPNSHGTVDYDQRTRGTLVEHCRRLAVAELERYAFGVEQMDQDRLVEHVELRAMVEPNGDRAHAASTIGRELMFVSSHTTHHQAIIAILLAQMGRPTPVRFGLAPSSPALASCARSA